MIHRKLENGVEVVIKENHFSPAVAIQCWIEAGSKDERPGERGLAHFLEHMLFKGTDKRAVGEIAATVEACGGDINAYTSFERTVFYLTMAKEHAAVGIELLSDAIINSTFDEVEFEREKEVILEEIKRGLDNPGQMIGRKVFELAYEGSEVGRPIIGSAEEVAGYTRDDLVAFYQRWYQPGNMRVLVVGDVDEQEALELVQETFGRMPAGEVPERVPVVVKPGTAPRAAVIKGDFQQPRLELVFPAPDIGHLDSASLDLAAYALGNGEMSRVNRRLRDEEGWIVASGVSLFSPGFDGVFELSNVVNVDVITEATAGLAREVARLHGADPVTEEELARARMNIRAERIYRDETVDGQARSLGVGLAMPDGVLFDDLYTTKLNKMSPDAICSAVQTWLRPDTAIIVALVPEDADVREEDLLEAFAKGWKEGQVSQTTTGAATRLGGKTRFEQAEVFDLKPGLRLVYRRNPEGELFSLTAASAGGLRAEDEHTAGGYSAMTSMFGLASQTRPYEQMVGLVESHGAALDGFSGKDSFGFGLQCMMESLTTLLPVFADAMLHPVFPEEQWANLLREVQATLTAQKDSPASQCIRRFQEELFGQHPYRLPVVGTDASVQNLDRLQAQEMYLKVRDGGPWVMAATGSLPGREVADMLKEVLADWQPRVEPRVFACEAMTERSCSGDVRLTKDREQTHIVHGYPGLTWGDTDRPALDVMANVLGGHGGRMFLRLRDQMSLAYTVTPIISYGCNPGLVGAYIACAPEKEEEAVEALRREMLMIIENPATDGELSRSRNYIIGNHEMGMQRSEAQTSTMALMELYGYGYDDFVRYAEAVGQVTVADVTRVARRIFEQGPGVTVRVGPEKT